MEQVKEKNTPAVGDIVRQAAWQVGAALFGFLLSRTALFDAYAPFGVTAVAGAPLWLTPAVAVGAALGYFLPVTGGSGFRYLAAVVVLAAIRFVLPKAWQTKSPALWACGLALVTQAATSAVVLLSATVTGALWLTLGIECLAAAGTAYFVAVASDLPDKDSVDRYTSAQAVSVVLLVGLTLMSLTRLAVAGVTLAGIVGLLLVLSAARFGGERGGALAGVTMGFALLLANGDRLWLAGAYAMGGLMAGLFGALGDVAGVIALDLVVLFFSLRVGLTETAPLLYETLAASLLSLLLPRAWQRPLAALFAPAPDMPRLDGLRKAVTRRLQFASQALNDIAVTVEDASARLGDMQAPTMDAVLEQVEARVCTRCAMRRYCWQDNLAQTTSALTRLTKDDILPDNADEELRRNCRHLDRVCETLRERYEDMTARREARRRVDEVRGVLMDQFGGLSDMLYDMACDMERDRRYDHETAERVDTALRGIGLYPTDVGCCLDGSGRMTVEIRLQASEKSRLNRMTLMHAVSDACERPFDPPCVQFAHASAFITLSEKAAYRLDVGLCRYAKGDARLCGDVGLDFTDGKGKHVLMLCDGMGTGGRAAVDSAMASTLMERLLKAGFGYDCALKLTNSAMRYKSTDESLSTVDICAIDLFSGRMELYKAGACPTVVLRGTRTAMASCASLPAGIVRQVGFDSAAVMLKAGDIVVLMSDGVTFDGTDWICAEVEAWHSAGTAQQLAEHLAKTARYRRRDGHEDDVTVLTAVLEKSAS